jgi:hypothetical protein
MFLDMHKKKVLRKFVEIIAILLGWLGTGVAFTVQISPFINTFLLLGSFPVAGFICFWLFKVISRIPEKD